MTTVYRLTISYRGSAYAGWQRQKNAIGVQQVVEEALGRQLGHLVDEERIPIFGAGRTDAGVHARGQVAHFDLPRPFPLRGLLHGTNHQLPSDIRILAADRMAAGFHARKSTVGKEYLYRVARGRAVSPLDDAFVMQVEAPLDVAAVRRGLSFLPGRHDFSAFALQGGSHGQPFRRLFAATVDDVGRELRFRFVGQGFLRGMVRTLVGTLIDIGRGGRPPENLRDLLVRRSDARPDRAGATAQARGLTLVQVFYPPEWKPLESYRA